MLPNMQRSYRDQAVSIVHLSGVRLSVCPVAGQPRSTGTAALAAARRFSMRPAYVLGEPCELDTPAYHHTGDCAMFNSFSLECQ